MKENRIIETNNLRYMICEFNYILDYYDENEVFFLLDEKFKIKGQKTGEIYILIPSWLEMQDLYQRSSKYNIMLKTHEIDEDLLVNNKIRVLCSKIVDSKGKSTVMSHDVVSNLHSTLAQFILDTTDEVIEKYYVGTSLNKEEHNDLTDDCFKYFSSVGKKRMGRKNVNVPPVPAPVLLMRICKMFNCTPDIARKISKRDIDMIMISREQESLCEDPAVLGFGDARSDGWR